MAGAFGSTNAGDPGLIPGLGRSPGEGNGNPLQYSCLENFLNRGAWQATVHGITRVEHNLATKPPPGFIVISLDSILKSRDITLPTQVCLAKYMVFPVVICGCKS